MWADTLFDIERGHLLRLGVWALVSVVLGLVLYLVVRKQTEAAFVRHFAIQSVVWGAITGALAAWSFSSLALRDYASATQFRTFAWFNAGLDVGYMGIGVTLAATAWIIGKRLGPLGAGVGIVVQGLALLVLDLRLMTLVEAAQIALAPSHGYARFFV